MRAFAAACQIGSQVCGCETHPLPQRVQRQSVGMASPYAELGWLVAPDPAVTERFPWALPDPTAFPLPSFTLKKDINSLNGATGNTLSLGTPGNLAVYRQTT